MKTLIVVSAAIAIVLSTGVNAAPTVIDLYGDKDGFGIGFNKDQSFSNSYPILSKNDAADVGTITDEWLIGSESWTHTYDVSGMGAITNAQIEISTLGQGWHGISNVYFDDVLVGQLTDGDNSGSYLNTNWARVDQIDLLTFGSLKGVNSIRIETAKSTVGADNDQWALDYSELRITSNPSPPPPPSTEISNVVFLPGMMASKLYECRDLDEVQLWPPAFSGDLSAITPQSSGLSNPGIYTRDILASPYERFATFMNNAFSSVGWGYVAYDWRLDFDQILSGVKIVTGNKQKCASSEKLDEVDLQQIIIDQARLSPTRQVSIVTHSNGGLLAKRLIQVLRANGNGGLVDKLIMVAAPQTGTPKSLAILLHGDEFGALNWYLPDARLRTAVRTMPGAYQLLPSTGLFQRAPFAAVEFAGRFFSDPAKTEKEIYNGVIDNYPELFDFLLARPVGSRSRPTPQNEFDFPEILDQTILGQAVSMHQQIDGLIDEPGLSIYQIVGRGLKAINTVVYKNNPLPRLNTDRILRYKDEPIDGDGTVLVPSASAMIGARTYFIDMPSCSRNEGKNRTHADIMELSAVQQLIKKILIDNIPAGQSPNIDCVREDFQGTVLRGVDRMNIRIASPVELHVYDISGRHTGPVSNPDPASEFRIAETEVIGSNFLSSHQLSLSTTDGPYEIELLGTGTGTFSLFIERSIDGVFVSKVIYLNVPVTNATRARLTLRTPDELPSLIVDDNGDGVSDLVVKPETNEPPMADTGPNRVVRLGSLVTLDGSASSDPDNGPSPLSYSWQQSAGPSATLSNANSATPTYRPTTPGIYTFSLTVNDDQSSSAPSSVNITVPALGDIDADGDVDTNDLARITAALNQAANGPNDLRDIDGDGRITALDSRKLVTLCTLPRCATR